MFMPVSRRDLDALGIEKPDFIYVIGDAYVDHSGFGPAIISRVLQAKGYTVAIISQPDWHSAEDFKALGEPRLGFLVSAGNMDSMVNHYTVNKKPRSEDMYSPGGEAGHRPDRATIVYSNRIREAFGKKYPIIIGGIEASLRRFAHYDYWSDKVRRSILIDSGADILIYGMGEHQIVEIADCLDSGLSVSDITFIKGTSYLTDKDNLPEGHILLPSFEEVSTDKEKYALSSKLEYGEQDAVRGKPLVQFDAKKYVVQNPPSPPLTTEELDWVYELPYENKAHPMYDKLGGVPAIKEVEFSLTSCRGCFGACTFCSLTFHQGKTVTARSKESLVREATKMTESPNFKGYIHDVGGPTANFRKASCEKQLSHGVCKDRQCLYPYPCRNLEADHSDYIDILRALRKIKGVKKVFIRSGVRYDYLLADKSDEFLYKLCKHHISGQLRIAPEHISDNVLKYMGKPKKEVYDRFMRRFEAVNKSLGLQQYAVPYLMSSHPGSTLKDAIALAEFLRDKNIQPQQVQDFYPTPGSLATTMYYTGIDPRTMEKVFVPKTFKEKQMQRALLQYRSPENYDLVFRALTEAKRTDLIGYGRECLIKPKGENKNGKVIKRKGSFHKDKGSSQGRNRRIKKRG